MALFFALETSSAACLLNSWLPHIGFNIFFPALLLKTWRIESIFGNWQRAKANKTKHTNNRLLLRLAGWVTFVALYLLLWSLVDPWVPTAEVFGSIEYITCKGGSSFWFLGIALVELVLLLAGLVMVCKGKDVPSLFQERKYLALCIYNLSLCWTFMALSSLLFPESPHVLLMVQMIFLIVVCNGTAVVLFGPKVQMVLTLSSEEEGNNTSSVQRSKTVRTSTEGVTPQTNLPTQGARHKAVPGFSTEGAQQPVLSEQQQEQIQQESPHKQPQEQEQEEEQQQPEQAEKEQQQQQPGQQEMQQDEEHNSHNRNSITVHLPSAH
mmetsp:Transcript_8439/g.16089  ORF Transcript_8439/g.16089 Transcript_8439/m.16089 type:complete len:323 (+) Transcript_8439:283-1251(+)